MRVVWIVLLLVMPVSAWSLVSEGRPGVPYFNHVLFLSKKIVDNDQVTWVTLGYGDPEGGSLECRNTIDVFNGKERFRDIPEGSWVLVDYELQSILIEEGFFGDADVSQVVHCENVDACCALRDKLNADPEEMKKRQAASRPGQTKKAELSDIAGQLEIGRQLTKAARCRACHAIEGFGAGHAPSLTWKRFKYEPGWLETFLKDPYRLRPAMNNLMMLRYTSPNARPSLQEPEVAAVSQYLSQVAWTKSPADRFRAEPYQDYDCFDCHQRLYREAPLPFAPTPVPRSLRERLAASGTVQLCFSCHAFGDYRQVAVSPGQPHPQALAPDLLLAMEKLETKYFVNFVKDPGYLQPGATMPKLVFRDSQIEEIRALVLEVKKAIAEGGIKPVHNFYRMKKRSSE